MKEQKKDLKPQARKFSRRQFIGSAAAAAAALSVIPAKAGTGRKNTNLPAEKAGFKLKYAPSLGMFAKHTGKDPVDQLNFFADQGFRAMFDNGLMRRPIPQQEAIAREMDRLNMTLGPFVAYADFSRKLYSYGGGSCFANAIQTSIINTLKQFSEVDEVKILVEGREAEIEP